MQIRLLHAQPAPVAPLHHHKYLLARQMQVRHLAVNPRGLDSDYPKQ